MIVTLDATSDPMPMRRAGMTGAAFPQHATLDVLHHDVARGAESLLHDAHDAIHPHNVRRIRFRQAMCLGQKLLQSQR